MNTKIDTLAKEFDNKKVHIMVINNEIILPFGTSKIVSEDDGYKVVVPGVINNGLSIVSLFNSFRGQGKDVVMKGINKFIIKMDNGRSIMVKIERADIVIVFGSNYPVADIASMVDEIYSEAIQ